MTEFEVQFITYMKRSTYMKAELSVSRSSGLFLLCTFNTDISLN